MEGERQSRHGQWSSRWAFILAASGAAVGLGNIWKFPYIAGENGGGAFVLVYLVCIILLGIPIMTAEIMIGRHGRQNPANSMKSVAEDSGRSQHWFWVGALAIASSFIILSYYGVIAGWALDYVFQALLGHFNQATPQHIDKLFEALVSNPWKLIFWDSLIMGGTISVVVFGVEKGLERSVRFMFPAMLAILLIIVIYSIDTGYFGHGLAFLFHPNFKALTPNSILIALGHAFFTLSLATGSIMMYGAYVPRDTSVPQAALAIAAADTAIALLAGLAIFPIVFANGLQPGAGPGLIFKTLPIAFGHMPYGQFIGVLFFLMLVFAAFTSAISLLEPTVAWLIEQKNLTRGQASMLGGGAMWLLGLGTVFSFNIGANWTLFGLNFFELMDYLTANIMLPLGGLLVAIFTAWRLNKQISRAEFNPQSSVLYKLWHFALAYISPLMIVIVFLNAIGVIKL
jgi:neurotransmitter:Na+ symporter, NSS family